MSEDLSHDHFHGKSVDKHIVEKFMQGVSLSQEPHGIETSGLMIAAVDGARTGGFSIALLLLLTCGITWKMALLAAMALAIAGFARASWMGWSRLERLHRMMEEERYEIEENREQERLELKELYRLKGFEEPLLTEVCEVLMADSDRLLKVMLEEELGLTLGSHDHPLVVGAWAGLGSLICSLFIIGTFLCIPSFLLYVSSFVLGLTGMIQAYALNNEKLPAFIWNGSLSFGLLFIISHFSGYLT